MFVAFEGIDGSGKTTVSRMVNDSLKKRGLKVWLTKEPTDDLVIPETLSADRTFYSGVEVFFLFTADRIRHADQIRKRLKSGSIVISDRFTLSSFAYQGSVIAERLGGLGRAVEWMMSVSAPVSLQPDLTILLDVDPEFAMRRIADSGRKNTGFEEVSYLERVRNAYLQIDFPGKISVDGSGTPESVTGECLSIIGKMLRP